MWNSDWGEIITSGIKNMEMTTDPAVTDNCKILTQDTITTHFLQPWWVCFCASVFACLCIYVSVFAYLCFCDCTVLHVCVYVFVCLCICVFMFLCIFASVYLCLCLSNCIHMSIGAPKLSFFLWGILSWLENWMVTKFSDYI